MFFKKSKRVVNPYPVPSGQRERGAAAAFEEMAGRGSFGHIGTHNPFSGMRDSGERTAGNGKITEFGRGLSEQLGAPSKLKFERLF